jgi:transaldolase/glucose-6-phosphate isomerase
VNPLLELHQLGQSVWLDDIHRRFVTGGDLQRLVREDGLAGITSNPTIFEKAIAGSGEYDELLRAQAARHPEADRRALFEALALEDIRMAADVLREVFERTEGTDGFVSFEVAPEFARDTEATISEARRLWTALDRPNVMIKVPATAEGIPAIEQLIADGINVNVTLMFSLAHYEAVAQAYVRGLERCAVPARVASVASFFVSRVDTVVDKALEQVGTPDALALRGRTAVANCKLVYQRFREIFHGAPFAALRARGCRVQRPLWASTSTKNPAYRDVIYVEELVGVETVNTLPPATLVAFRDHGDVRGTTVDEEIDEARRVLASVRRLGIDLDRVTAQLQVDGVAAFARSYDDLLDALDTKRGQVASAPEQPASIALGALAPAVSERVERWQRESVGRRIWDKDHTVWVASPVPELTDRLGWLSMPERMPKEVAQWTAFADEIRADGLTHVVLLGMGGSSLAPEVFEATFGHRDGYPELIVLDSTHPDAVRRVDRQVDPQKTLFVVSSKSGTTGETNSFFKYFWARFRDGQAGPHFIAITDPGTPLERLARERGFRAVFNAPSDIGGRYSALTPFGLVPATLIGVEVQALLARAACMAQASAPDVPVAENPALLLGAALGELARAGRDKLTFLVEPAMASFPAWLEQLIAESTGKNDQGIVPVADEGPWPPDAYGSDRVFVTLEMAGQGSVATTAKTLEQQGHPVIRVRLKDRLDLGQEFFRWELATAAAGAVLGIQPFDQPDVQVAKDLARRAMEETGTAGTGGVGPLGDATGWAEALASWIGTARPGDYVALHAYLAPRPEVTDLLQQLREALGRPRRLATTVGYGPRFLHSTGQLHKGGPNSGLFLQLTDEPGEDLEVPETNYTFGELIAAQAAGDAMALGQRGRRLLRISVGQDVEGGLRRLVEMTKAIG